MNFNAIFKMALFFSFSSFFLANSQTVNLHKKITLGPFGIYNEALLETEDSCFLIAGYEYLTASSYYFVLSKYNYSCNNVWCKKYSYNNYERYPQIHHTEWGDYLLSTADPAQNSIIRCVDKDGNGKWKAILHTTLGDGLTACTFDNGAIFIAGRGGGGPFIIKTDTAGNLLWRKIIFRIPANGANLDIIIKLNEGNMLLIGGYAHNSIIKIDTSGNNVSGYDVTTQDSISNYVQYLNLFKTRTGKILGSGRANGGILMFEMDTLGNVLWSNLISSNYVLGVFNFSQFDYGDILFTTNVYDSISQYHASMIGRADSMGNIIQSFVIGSDSVFAHDNASIAASNDGIYSFATFERIKPVNSLMYSYMAIMDTSVNAFNSCNTRPLILYQNAKNLILTPTVYDTISSLSPTYIKTALTTTLDTTLDSVLCITTSVEELIPKIYSLNIQPNPFRTFLYLKGTKQGGEIVIYDISGKIIRLINSYDEETRLDTGQLNAGFYLVKYKNKNTSVDFKVIKL